MSFVLQKLANYYFSRKFALFVLFGGTAALVNLLVGVLFYDYKILSVPYGVAVFVAACCGLCVNFSLNALFNFKNAARNLWQQFRTFSAVSFLGIWLTVLFAWCLVRLMERFFSADGLVVAGRVVSIEFSAHFLAVGVVTFYSYAAHDFFSFNVGIRAQVRNFLSSRTNRAR